jgi:hypothetical protein
METTDRLRPRGLLAAASLAVLLLAACGSDPTARRQATETCTARGLDPASAAFSACVADVENQIYISWGRDRVSKGD